MTDTVAAWDEPYGVNPRGTLIVLAGRGERSSVYARFGARLAFDAYKVRVVSDVAENVARARQQVSALLTDETLVGPKILVGADAGALLALQLAVHPELGIDAVIVAGAPVDGGVPPTDWDDELEVRTACPTHQGVLSRESERGAVAIEIPTSLCAVTPANVKVPVLVLHGGSDTISPWGRATDDLYQHLPNKEIAVVEGGRHDALNDASHRTVAATIILFLERLKVGSELLPIVRLV
ncbi:serine aminopeptidase domain-containing protein [Rhodococcus globerulus]|uniref:Alpha/beta hydrolase n=1 Tax=Rhodococcus globerulus TaxID=33008 RepID=A0ABU4C4J7_RHOGO|nr:alpha/beta hydrolase [Rhodococcus globerulus]MDV6271441.1 alpha/beta hydrolase [Rhodococcus globerulus]